MDKFKVETINGLPVVDNGRVLIDSKKHLNIHSSIDNPASDRDILNSDNYDESSQIDSDVYLSNIIESLKLRTLVVGIGGAGNNAISRLQEIGVPGAITMAVNTDAQDLFYANADKKMLIGKKITSGLGAGNNPAVGAKCAESDLERIKKCINRDVVFINCGLGGGTGTGAAPIFAREAKKSGALVVSFCTLPFNMEGEEKRLVAFKGLSKLAEYSDTIIPIPNERLLRLLPNISMMKGFKIMDEILIRSVKSIVDLISNCGLVNLDLADVKSVLSKRARSSGFIGLSEINIEKLKSKTNNYKDKQEMKQILRQRTIKALHNPLLDINVKSIRSCLVSIVGDQTMSLAQINEILSTITHHILPSAKLKFGTMIDPAAHSIKICIIGLADASPYLSRLEEFI
ncbi:MAG: cell division protein FtsZ [Candidatus Lokiarchaeota archaeon]|nr:cell division protein FtsZ [Candidatus Lokiarchaeota archaeon]